MDNVKDNLTTPNDKDTNNSDFPCSFLLGAIFGALCSDSYSMPSEVETSLHVFNARTEYTKTFENFKTYAEPSKDNEIGQEFKKAMMDYMTALGKVIEKADKK